MNKLALMIGIFCHIAFLSSAQTIRGKVMDAQTKEPLPSATIQLINSAIGTVTNNEGYFELEAGVQNPMLKIAMMGYQSVEIAGDFEKMMFISLEVAVQELQSVVVTASREASLRTEAAMAISKLSPKMIEEAKPVSLYEIINKTPGVLMVNLGNEQHSMSIRQPMTTSGYYLYMEDGIGIRPMGVFNHNALLEINQLAIGNIEVVKGPVSSIYGPEAVGGAINFITQRPSSVPTARIGVQFDQWGYKRLQAGAGATLGKLGIFVAGLRSTQQGSWMAASDYDKSSVNARLEYKFSNKTRVYGTWMYGKYYSQMSGSVDSIAFYARQYVSTSDFTYRKSESSRARITLERDWNSHSKTFLTTFYRFNEHGQNPAYAIRWTPGQTTARGEINSNNFKSYGVLAQHSQRFKWADSKLIAGLLYDYTPNNYWSYQVDLNAKLRADGRSVEQYTIKAERPDIKLADYNAKIYNTAAYLQYDFEPMKKMRISIGARYDQMTLDYSNALDKSTGTKVYSQPTLKIGITYDLGKDRGLYANYAQGFAPPALTAIFRKRPNTNPADFYYNLAPAHFDNIELGGWMSALEGKFYVDLALYQMNGRNELLNIRQPDNSFDYQSAGKTLHRGIELGTTYRPSKQFFVRWGGTVALHRFEDFLVSTRQGDAVQNLQGFEMPSAPRWTWNTEASYYPSWAKGLRTALEWQRVSGWYQNQINTVRYDGYHLLNWRTGYEWKGVEVYVNIMNVTNALYAANVSTGNNATDRSTFTPAAPRTFVMGIQYRY